MSLTTDITGFLQEIVVAMGMTQWGTGERLHQAASRQPPAAGVVELRDPRGVLMKSVRIPIDRSVQTAGGMDLAACAGEAMADFAFRREFLPG